MLLQDSYDQYDPDLRQLPDNIFCIPYLLIGEQRLKGYTPLQPPWTTSKLGVEITLCPCLSSTGSPCVCVSSGFCFYKLLELLWDQQGKNCNGFSPFSTNCIKFIFAFSLFYLFLMRAGSGIQPNWIQTGSLG